MKSKAECGPGDDQPPQFDSFHEKGYVMTQLSRREFAQATLGSLLGYSLLETIFRQDAFADEVKPLAIEWLKQVNSLAADVRDQKLKQVEWQKQIEALFQKIDPADVLPLIDFNALTKDLKIVDSGANSLRPKFPKVEEIGRASCRERVYSSV